MRLRLLQTVNSYLSCAILVNVVMTRVIDREVRVKVRRNSVGKVGHAITTFTRIVRNILAHDRYELTTWRSLSLIKI